LYSTVVPKQSKNGENVEGDGRTVGNRPGAIEATTVTDLIDLGETSKVCLSVEIFLDFFCHDIYNAW
jgi:hypothetical protein